MSLFGTDGVRGVANVDLTPEVAVSLGRAAGRWLRDRGGCRVAMGRDTRSSGTMLGAAVASGLCSEGLDVVTMGVAPTPAVSFATRAGDFDMGVVISASHNPPSDNGIKFLSSDGAKLGQEQEAEIESLITIESRGAVNVGRISQDDSWKERYVAWLASFLPQGLPGWKVVIDCANGAATSVAPDLFKRLGADAVYIGNGPDGLNINEDCGATRPRTMLLATLETQAVLGVSFDGDADRCVFSDEQGRLINGDRTMAVWSVFEKHHGRLEPPVVVGTIMSNLALERVLAENGISLVRTQVGDRNVARAMDDVGAKIGGEQSGHIIFGGLAPTGDGLLTAVQVMSIMRRAGCAASELQPLFDNWPQVMVNVVVDRKNGWQSSERIREAIAASEAELRNHGRLVVRASGTQPVIRVMVEADDAELRDRIADGVVAVLIRELGGSAAERVDLTNALGD